MDRRERRKSEQKAAKRIRGFYGKKAKISKSDLHKMEDEMKQKGFSLMTKKLLIGVILIIAILMTFAYIGYF